ncbi:ABC-F family ATP-binding cassette domain-containing protein [Pelagibacterium halotolerans]|uniref:ABC-F family ATP-binding cassette domain-containing protein n=1 Tax=Pelagibacterium halotolerans TaxID=531813 RepID=UPI00384AAD97
MLTITNLHYKIQGRPLFEGASVTLPTGAKAGFVGKNGSGKTTLFGLIQGQLAPEQGTIEVHRRARIGAVAQEAPASDMSVLDMVLSADTERTALLAEAETASDPHRIADIHTRLADIDAHTAEARASAVLRGLGFSLEKQHAPCRELSGGWRMRISLAGVLFTKPDLLLLDEPTNYLDLEGTLWLEKYLATYPYTVFMISHDRDLLNKAVDSIIHLERGKLTFYKGAYDTFEETRRMQMELNNKAREKTLAQIEHMQKYVDRFRYKANKAKQAQSRLKAIAKLRPPEALFDEYAAPFSFQQPQKPPATPMITFDNVAVGYGDTVVLRGITNRIDPDDRIALVGVNGNGKSTFAKLIAGDLRPMDGRMQKAKTLDVAFFAQHQLDKLKPEQTPYEHVIDLMPLESEAKRRSRVAQMGLSTSRMDTKAKDLSGGERARLLMGLITFNGPGMLILDEPTNHLDIDSRDALVHALNDYKGAVLIISHDRHLVEATCDKLWIAEGGTISVFDDDLDGYQKSLVGNSGNGSSGGGGSASERKRERQEAAARRAELAPLRKEIKQIEQKLEWKRKDLDKIDSELSNPALYTGDPDRAIALGIDKSKLETVIGELEERWLEKSAAYEEAQAEGSDAR